MSNSLILVLFIPRIVDQSADEPQLVLQVTMQQMRHLRFLTRRKDFGGAAPFPDTPLNPPPPPDQDAQPGDGEEREREADEEGEKHRGAEDKGQHQ